MKDIKDITALVIDHGLFPFIAERLARDCKRVLYWCTDERAMPTMHDGFIGDLGNAERTQDPWKVKNDVDLFVFPDIGYSGHQLELVDQGKAVWGARSGDELEIYRGKFLQALKDLDLSVPPHTVVTGISNLKTYLKGKKDKYIKLSKWRGDWETFHFRDWDQDEHELICRECRLGCCKELVTFYVFDKIESEIEDGIDPWCIDGKFPNRTVHALESKDRFCVATFSDMAEVPDQIQEIYERFSPVLEGYGYRAGFSSEVRITKDKEAFFIDPTCRFGSPPSQMQVEMVDNFSEVIWAGANGECIEPVESEEFAIQGVVDIGADNEDWATLRLPEKLNRWIKPSFCFDNGSSICFPPVENAIRCWMVAIGASLEEAMDNFKDQVAMLPSGVTCDMSPLADLLKEIEETEDIGLPFTDKPAPEPASVLKESD